jgi:hypothetical protein
MRVPKVYGRACPGWRQDRMRRALHGGSSLVWCKTVQEYAATVARRNLYYEVRVKEGVGTGGIYADLLAFLDDAEVREQSRRRLGQQLESPLPFFHSHHGPSVGCRPACFGARGVRSPVSIVPPRMACRCDTARALCIAGRRRRAMTWHGYWPPRDATLPVRPTCSQHS